MKSSLRAKGAPGGSGALRSFRSLRIGRIGSGTNTKALHKTLQNTASDLFKVFNVILMTTDSGDTMVLVLLD